MMLLSLGVECLNFVLECLLAFILSWYFMPKCSLSGYEFSINSAGLLLGSSGLVFCERWNIVLTVFAVKKVGGFVGPNGISSQVYSSSSGVKKASLSLLHARTLI